MRELVVSVDLANLGQDVSSWKALSGWVLVCLVFFFLPLKACIKINVIEMGFLVVF